MKFEKHFPTEQLKPFINYFVVSEHDAEREYTVFPSSGMVIGFQYRGELAAIEGKSEYKLAAAGVTGIADSYKVFKSSTNIGTILVYFSEIGFTHFAAHPAHELFNLSISLNEIFAKNEVSKVENELAMPLTDKQRIKIVETFLIAQLKEIQTDKLVLEAVKLIHQSKGTIRINELIKKLAISQSPFEKRFRKVVGTTPKKFTSLIRFNVVLTTLTPAKSLTEICYENNFFDQAHFIKDFKGFTGQTPESFKRFL